MSTDSGETGITKAAWRALAAACVGYAVDGFDLLVLGFMLEPIATSLGVDRVVAAALVTWTLIGAVGGGMLFGLLGDRFGRVRALSWSIIVFAVFTGLCAFARDYRELALYRALAGLGLGGEFGLGMALVAETWPPAWRARACSYVGVGWQFGVLGAAFLAPVLLPHIGWRGVFLLGAVPAIFAFRVRRALPEPQIFHNASSGGSPVETLAALVASGERIRSTVGMAILCTVQNFGYYGFMVWLPTHLSVDLGYTLSKSSIWIACTVVGMIAGALAFGAAADRFGRRPTFLFYQASAGMALLFYASLHDPLALLFVGAIAGFFVNGMIGGYGALLAELYPTAARATAENLLFNLGRGFGGFGPMIIGALATQLSFEAALVFLASLYIIDMLATIFLIPEKRGAPLI
jgi:MFS family permease